MSESKLEEANWMDVKLRDKIKKAVKECINRPKGVVPDSVYDLFKELDAFETPVFRINPSLTKKELKDLINIKNQTTRKIVSSESQEE